MDWKKIVVGVVVLVCLDCWLGVPAVAQGYSQAIGVRFGYPHTGFSYKMATANPWVLQGVVGADYRYGGGRYGFLVLALFERYRDLGADIEGTLSIFYGPGVQAGFYYHDTRDLVRHMDFAVGGGFIFGLEYVLPDIPIGVSLDIYPNISFAFPHTDDFFPFWVGGGLAFHFILD